MNEKNEFETSKGTVRRATLPKTRGPFVNAELIALGPGEDGAERFWITTWNAKSGTTGVMVTERGDCRVYRTKTSEMPGFYSAVIDCEDPNTLWLCGWLSHVVKLDLTSGEFKPYETGLPGALAFQGMILDPETKKLFAVAFPTHPPRPAGFSFDTRALKTAKVFDPLDTLDHSMRASFPNGDGTWTAILHTPGETFVQWDPKTDEIRLEKMLESFDSHVAPDKGSDIRVAADAKGRVYLPGRGWFDPLKRKIVDGPRPAREAAWFDRDGASMFGVAMGRDKETAAILAWDLETGEVRELCGIPGMRDRNVARTTSGAFVSVGMYGDFSLHDPAGALKVAKRLPTDDVGAVDCVRRIDRDRVLGTTFISQRFFEVNLKTGTGVDCGRAAPGGGQICRTTKIGGKIYMAAYTGGELVEYDPARPLGFPENPRVVAKPPGGMRPVGIADDGRNVYYSCSRHYGLLGSVMARHDTVTGANRYSEDPLLNQQIRSLAHDSRSGLLLAGTTMNADCMSAPAIDDQCFLASLDPNTLEAIEKRPLPDGAKAASIVGRLDGDRWLCSASGFADSVIRWFAFDVKNIDVPEVDGMKTFPADMISTEPSGKPGVLVARRGNRFLLWDVKAEKEIETLFSGHESGDRIFVDDESVFVVTGDKLLLLEGALSDL